MQITAIRELYDYNYWANRRILDKAALVSERQLKEPTGFSFDSLHSTLVHTMSAEWLWRTRMQEGVSPPAMHNPAAFPTLERLVTAWGEEETTMRAFLATLSDDDVGREFVYTNTQGESCSNMLWQSLVHLVFHGMQHRAECAAMLTSFEHSPGWIDFIVFVREKGVSNK